MKILINVPDHINKDLEEIKKREYKSKNAIVKEAISFYIKRYKVEEKYEINEGEDNEQM